MKTILAGAVLCGVITMLAPAHATPIASLIAPLTEGVTADIGVLTDVQWRRCWRDRWGRVRCRGRWDGGWGPGWGPGWGGGWGRDCRRDRWGRLHCRW